jgi:glycosyltransferase involved in cell wall biosynthesis
MAARVPKAVVIHNWADAALEPAERRALPSGENNPSSAFGTFSPHEGRRLSKGTSPREPSPRARGEGARRADEGQLAFTVGYSGNLGRAHDFETIAGAMKRLPRVKFVFTGGGAQLDAVKSAAPANAEFRAYVAREQLSESLSSVDAHLVSLKPALEGLIVPSKFYGILAVARPVIFIGAHDGELARLIEAYRCGVVVEPGDVEGLVRAVENLAREHELSEQMGLRGRELYLHRFAPRHAFAAWERILGELAA